MKKDGTNKKKMFEFVRRLKENARRNQTQNRLTPALKTNSSETSNRLEATSSHQANEEMSATTSLSNQNQLTATNQSTIGLNPLPETSTKNQPKKTNEAAAISTATDDNNCSICLRENNEPALCNECFHCFCLPCIQQWSEQSNQCPVCRREYSMIIFNIRSETEYDQLPVTPRRSRGNEFEIILPLGNFVEFDRAFERLINLPPLQPMNPANNNLFLQSQLPPINGLNQTINRPSEVENSENMITFSVTNYNAQPDQNGQRLIQRTFFFSEPPTNLDANQTNLISNTPRSSLDQNNLNQPLFTLFNPVLLRDPNLMQQQQPTVVFNPNNYREPYRNLENNRTFLSPTTGNLHGMPTNLAPNSRFTRDLAPQSIDTLFDRLFNDLTQILPPSSNQRQRTTSFPITENSTSFQINRNEASPDTSDSSGNTTTQNPTARRIDGSTRNSRRRGNRSRRGRPPIRRRRGYRRANRSNNNSRSNSNSNRRNVRDPKK